MSNSGSAPSPTISLPTGGGSLRGLGEKFAPDLHTGTGNHTIPILLLPGRNGFQPDLSIVYSTGAGNGPLGLGWSLSVPGVVRRTAKGVPRYVGTDVFILSGAEDLVPIPGGPPGATRYRPRTEGLFALIDHHHDAGNDYWQVRSRDGLASLYGTPATAGIDPAAVADPADRTRVFAWKLSQTTDHFGNRIAYEYERDSGEDGPHHWDQLYLSRIRYGDYRAGNQTGFLFSVTFVYAERFDPFSEYRPGFEVRTRKRCSRIEVRTHAGVDRLVRIYHLVYLDELDSVGHMLPPNGVSLLSRIRVVGHDGDLTEELPPLEFSYTRFEPEKRDFFPLQGADMPGRSLADPDMELVDLFGHGLPDVLEMNGSVRFWRNLGGGRFDLPRSMPSAPAGMRLGDAGVQLIDADGDGRTDLMITTEGLSGYFPMRFGGLWDHRSFRRYRQSPSFDLEDPEVRLVDLDGDGVTDAVRSGARFECFFNDPEVGWSSTRRVERQAQERFPDVNFSDPRVKWADMTGDGLQDIVLVNDGNVEYWPSRGHGNWGPRVSMRNSPRLPFRYDPRRILVGDVDGDGLADIIYVDDARVTLWINRCGNDWSEPIEIEGTPPVSDLDTVRLADALGSGVAGVLWSTAAGAPKRPMMWFLDFTGGIKPYLLCQTDNRAGAVTRVEYRPSTWYFLEDQRRPSTRWKTPLPFPVQVVARVEVIDIFSGGKLCTEYRYHHGYWDGGEREFRGFGMVEQFDTEPISAYAATGLHDGATFVPVAPTHFSPPTLTKTWFHLGPVGDEFGEWDELDLRAEYWTGDEPALTRPPETTDLLKRLPRRARRDALRALRGSVLRSELYAVDGTARKDRPYTVTEHVYGLREEEPPDANDRERKRIFFPHARGPRTTQWERGDDPMTRFDFTEDYDSYGQPGSRIDVAVPRWRVATVAADAVDPYLATYTVTEHAQRDDGQRYLVDRVARTTTFEIKNDGTPPLDALLQQIRKRQIDGLIVQGRPVIDQALCYYDGAPFEGLDLGKIGDFGALTRRERLVLTEAILHDAYRSGSDVVNAPEMPPYLSPGGAAWTVEYPLAFRDLPPLAGYVFSPGDEWHERGYFATTEQCRYDVHDQSGGRGLLLETRDPLGRATTVVYDQYELMPVAVTNSAGLTTTAAYDNRVFQPREVTDPNGNSTVFTYTPAGLLASGAVMDKAGHGDLPDQPSARFVYDFLAFDRSPPDARQPISVRTIRRVHHAGEDDVPVPESDETVQTVEYTDGFGHLLQTRAQAEDVIFGHPTLAGGVLPTDQTDAAGTKADVVGKVHAQGDLPSVIVSGWQIYDNKGRVVEKYEPFFSQGWAYSPPGGEYRGQKATLFYDPRGQVIRTVSPDGSEQRVVYGVPATLDHPEPFAPTPWESYTYDANDNAGRTHPEAALAYLEHWNTPASAEVDALGRRVRLVARNGSDPVTDWFVTASSYDIRGNLLTVTDPLGRPAVRHVYDLVNRPLRVESIDAGVRRSVIDAAGNGVEGRDSKGALVLHKYDVLSRPIRVWARDETSGPVTLRQRQVYGDGADSGLSGAEAVARNLLGKLHRHYDEAGLLTIESYDLKGNMLEKVRRVLGDAAALADAPPDWPDSEAATSQHAASVLGPRDYRTSTQYDALKRVKSLRYPEDVDGNRKELRPSYNRAGALERVALDGEVFVAHISYDAKGQRTLVAYGNGVLTRRAYDPRTFRLVRLRSERYTRPDDLTFHPTGAPLQDLAYNYDLAGNVRTIRDRTPGGGVPNTPLGPDALDRTFTYDPLCRLLSATGREHASQSPDSPWLEPDPPQDDSTLTRGYSEQYLYDQIGNMRQLQHAATGSSFTRLFALFPGGNQLATVSVGQNTFDYSYDANGNMLQETTSRHFEWDYADRMRGYRTQPDETSPPSVRARYLYDAAGQRVVKLVQKGVTEVTVYVDGIFEHHRRDQGSAAQENNILHVMDNQSRIALMRVGAPFQGANSPAVTYHLGDHLGSSNLVIDASGAWMSREEYTPYGETSFGTYARKRYRFTGKERDEESGLYYHGARYYAPWLARWPSCDPLGIADGMNLYRYVHNNPVRLVDPSGTQTHQDTEGAEGAPAAYGPSIQSGIADMAEKLIHQVRQTQAEDAAIEAAAEQASKTPVPARPISYTQPIGPQHGPEAGKGSTEAPPLSPEQETGLWMDTIGAMAFSPVSAANVFARSQSTGDIAELNNSAHASDAPEGVLRALGGTYLSRQDLGGTRLPETGETTWGAPLTPVARSAESGGWQMRPDVRGVMYHQYRRENLPPFFNVIDVAPRPELGQRGVPSPSITSLKSLDPRGPTYAPQGAVYDKLTDYVDALSGFTAHSRAGVTVSADANTWRILQVGMPPGGLTAQQQMEFLQAMIYASQRGVILAPDYVY